MERHSFRRVSGESPETLRRLCLSIKFAHEEIRKKFRHFAQLLVFWKLSKSFQVLSYIKYKLFNSLYVLDCPLLNTFFLLSLFYLLSFCIYQFCLCGPLRILLISSCGFCILRHTSVSISLFQLLFPYPVDTYILRMLSNFSECACVLN